MFHRTRRQGGSVSRRNGSRPQPGETGAQYQACIGRKPIPAGKTEFGLARASDHRRQMDLYGRARGLLRQSPLRPDSIGTGYRAEYPDRPAVAPRCAGSLSAAALPKFTGAARVPVDRYGARSLRIVRNHAGLGGPMACEEQAAAPAASPEMRPRLPRLRHLRQVPQPNRRRRHAISAKLRSQGFRRAWTAIAYIGSQPPITLPSMLPPA